ncbi:thioester reductase [Streptomyces eurocidicus]|uniref:Thioester reductase n=1 Tax=Streptomyces eurocidicus TaxID=66423 RepID=A0A2N8NUL2_STREU|nr:amino acid adenylation domain-containing protein [Streptomyces eurocidicus]MBB5120323.1 amino acid adenylation domain-containing protein/thioester reductase-like protein [Streptomyces eurocidicus]PNE32455.1 thioester reductase [Streptomyces eurocidicus]
MVRADEAGATTWRTGRLHELFEEQAARRPDALAARYGEHSLTYRELGDRSGALADRLYAAGVRGGDAVGVAGTRSPEALVAFLGVLKAGAAYVPLDDTHPPARLQAMAEDAGVRAAVVLPGSTCRIRNLRARLELGGGPRAAAAEAPAADVPRAAPRAPAGSTADDPAYVMFTSGTTGRPKPVAIPHRGVARLALTEPALGRPGPGDRVLHAYGLSSDASTIEIWSALLGGAALVLVDREVLLSPTALEQVLLAQRVTVAYLTTSVFHLIARTRPETLRTLRYASAGGEALDADLVRKVRAACPGTVLANLYGPTENSVVSTVHVLDHLPEDAVTVPIGSAVAYASAHVVREDGTLAAPGEEGELWVGGDGLALGYVNDPGRTAERFVDASFPVMDTPRPGRFYRTGDRAVRNTEGLLEYRGRTDRQIKLRGHRVELEEVEARLRAHPAIAEAAVETVRHPDGEGHLIAHVTGAVAGTPVPVDSVRRDLAAWLPAPAVPARLLEYDRLPVAATGKVDRRELGRPHEDPAPAAAGGMREAVAGIWELALRIRPAAHDSFFGLGGDSLLAAQVVTRTLAVFGIGAEHGSTLVRGLLDRPTLHDFTQAVRDVRDTGGTGRATPSGDPVDFAAEARLGFTLPPAQGPEPRWERPAHILLTGASGFVGAFLLHRMLHRTQARVHCPVRARDAAHALRRVRAALERYGLPTEGLEQRVTCFPGDLTEPSLGLAPAHAEELSRTLDLIVHNGAQVNFLYPYEALRAANVQGTREIVALAAPRRVPVHFLSTIAVVAGFGTAGVRHVPEDLPLAHADRITMGYGESKWVAEGVLQDAARQGLPVTIHRPYEVTGEQRGGVCNTETAICSLFKTIAETGVAPDIELPLDFVPVDHLADAVTHIATHQRATGRVLHLTNPRPARLTDMLDRMRAAGFPVRTLPYDGWVGELVRHVARHPTAATAPFVSLCVDRANGSAMSVKEMYLEGTFPAIGRENAETALAGSGLACPPVDARLLDRYLHHFLSTGYLDRPGTPRHSACGSATEEHHDHA